MPVHSRGVAAMIFHIIIGAGLVVTIFAAMGLAHLSERTSGKVGWGGIIVICGAALCALIHVPVQAQEPPDPVTITLPSYDGSFQYPELSDYDGGEIITTVTRRFPVSVTVEARRTVNKLFNYRFAGCGEGDSCQPYRMREFYWSYSFICETDVAPFNGNPLTPTNTCGHPEVRALWDWPVFAPPPGSGPVDARFNRFLIAAGVPSYPVYGFSALEEWIVVAPNCKPERATISLPRASADGIFSVHDIGQPTYHCNSKGAADFGPLFLPPSQFRSQGAPFVYIIAGTSKAPTVRVINHYNTVEIRVVNQAFTPLGHPLFLRDVNLCGNPFSPRPATLCFTSSYTPNEYIVTNKHEIFVHSEVILEGGSYNFLVGDAVRVETFTEYPRVIYRASLNMETRTVVTPKQDLFALVRTSDGGFTVSVKDGDFNPLARLFPGGLTGNNPLEIVGQLVNLSPISAYSNIGKGIVEDFTPLGAGIASRLSPFQIPPTGVDCPVDSRIFLGDFEIPRFGGDPDDRTRDPGYGGGTIHLDLGIDALCGIFDGGIAEIFRSFMISLILVSLGVRLLWDKS